MIVNDGARWSVSRIGAEQLIAESTGKSGTGVLPVAVSEGAELSSGANDILMISLVLEDADLVDNGDAVAISGSWPP